MHLYAKDGVNRTETKVPKLLIEDNPPKRISKKN